MKKLPALDQESQLQRYKQQYYRLTEDLKSKCSWNEIQDRLLANNNFYLKLASDLDKSGLLFGIDGEGNALFADGGEEPVFMYMTYFATRKKVCFKTGYEMFPFQRVNSLDKYGSFKKSPEIEMFENYTGKPFIKPLNAEEWRCSWLESGEKPDFAGDAIYNPATGKVAIFDEAPTMAGPSRGVRRLLRVKKL